MTKTVHADGSWDTVAYTQTTKTITANVTWVSPGESIQKTYDGLGNIISSIQTVTENGYQLTTITTTYQYDGFSNLTGVTDTVGNVTSYTYDVLGRKIGITDPDAGTRTQTYTAFGELATTADGLGVVARMQYDALSRMTGRCWTKGPGTIGPGQSCPNPGTDDIYETWTYDPTNGIGELGQETSTQGQGYSATHTYNSGGGIQGQPATSSITIAGSTPFNYAYSYDTNNRPSSYTSPSGAVPTTQYNIFGYISKLIDAPPSGSTTMWTANSRDAENHLTQATYGNGINTTYTYDPPTGRLTNLLTTNSGGVDLVQSLTYGWDVYGNLHTRTDAVNSLNETYYYDELNRLTEITSPTTNANNLFWYDVLGNMQAKADVGTYDYPPAGSPQPHGVTTIYPPSGSGTTTFTYDADGNVLTESGLTARTFTWTIFNMPLTIKRGAHKDIFQYDADHNRVMQTNGGSNLTYYLPDGEFTPSAGSGPVWHTYFEMDGERVAEDAGPTGALVHQYFQNDYQNTIGMVTGDNFVFNPPAGTLQNEGSDVFGQPRSPSGSVNADPTWGANDVTKRRYINQEDLTDTQLIDLNARVYDPLFGKFMSPDPVISDQDDSQSWNAYAYAHNNPMSKEDPTGRDPNVVAANAASDALENTTSGPLAAGNSGGSWSRSAYGTFMAKLGVASGLQQGIQVTQLAPSVPAISSDTGHQVLDEFSSHGDRAGTDNQVYTNNNLVTGPGHVTVDSKSQSVTISGGVYDNGTGQGQSFINAVDSKNGGWSGKFKGSDGFFYSLTTSLHSVNNPTQAFVGLTPCPGGSCGKGIGGFAERGGFWIDLPSNVSATTDRHEFGHILGLGHQTSRSSIMEYSGGNGVVGAQDLDRVGQHYLDEGLRFQSYMQTH